MSLSSIARTKKRTGELSFQTKLGLFKDAVGEEVFKGQEESLLNLGRMLYNQLRIDGVLPKRAKAWEKLDYQDQLKWGASANDLVAGVQEAETHSKKNGLLESVGSIVSKVLAPKAVSFDPAMVGGEAMSLEEIYKKLGVEKPAGDAPVVM